MSSPRRMGLAARAWYRWKALRLPWRKRFLVGYDLAGNTYWEFRLTRRAAPSERLRRIVEYPRSTHYSEVRVGPQWHQWLRHTRQDPPSLAEQQGDVVRQARLQQLAAQADARWEAKPRAMDAAPAQPTGPPLPALGTARSTQGVVDPALGGLRNRAKARGAGEKWQPSSWNHQPNNKGGQRRTG